MQGLLMKVSHPSISTLLPIPPHQTLGHSFLPPEKKTLINDSVLLNILYFL